MSGTPDVSVITANYNGARYLAAAVQSVLRQTHASWELILVDDASTDESVRIARKVANGDPRVKIVVQDRNRGPAAARNAALAEAKGNWIAVFDSDDIMLPTRLEALLSRGNAYAETIVADNLLLFSESTEPRPFLSGRLGRESHCIGLADFIESNCLYSGTPDLGYLKPMIRTEVVRRFQTTYDAALRIGEDYNFLARLLAQGHRLRLEPDCLYLYRKHESSISHRLCAADIEALLDAEDRFTRQAGPFDAPVVRALEHRHRSLESLLIYDRVIHALKDGNPAKATSLALPNPHMWRLLARPIIAHIARFAARDSGRLLDHPSPIDDEAKLQSILLQASTRNLRESST